MRAPSIALLIGTAAVVGTFFLSEERQTPDRKPSPQPGSQPRTQPTARSGARHISTAATAKPAYRHLILQLEGNIHGLTVTWITPKTSGYNKTKVTSKFEVDLLDGRGARLGTYPIDLANFDTNPARVGKPLRVEGCEVRDSKIVTIVNVPWFEATASMRIRNGGIVIGKLDSRQLAKLVAQGEVR